MSILPGNHTGAWRVVASLSMPQQTTSPLTESNRYDPSIVPQLEAYVETQCADQTYDIEANLALLKLYQFHPETLKVPLVAKVLVKALMNLPQTDYLACMYLVPERVLDEEPIKTVAAVAALLETCSFRKFWEEAAPLRAELLAGTPGFDTAVRNFMLRTFEITYQSVPAAHLKASLGFDSDADFAALVSARGWTVAGDLVKMCVSGIEVCALSCATHAMRPGGLASQHPHHRVLHSVWQRAERRQHSQTKACGCSGHNEPGADDQNTGVGRLQLVRG